MILFFFPYSLLSCSERLLCFMLSYTSHRLTIFTIFIDTIYNIIFICLIVSGYRLSTLQRWEKKVKTH